MSRANPHPLVVRIRSSEAMAMRLVLNAVLLYVILQFFIQDAEGQILRKSSLDDCISNMIQADSSKGMPNKLSEVLEQWQPSLTGIISHWLWQQIPTQENELCARCRDNKCFDGLDHNDLKEHFKDIAKEVYGRGVVQNLIINTLILGGKFSLSAGSGGVKVGSDLIQLVLEYFSFPLATYTGKAVGLIGSTGAGAWGGYTNWGDDGVVGGALLGLLPWIYCEVRLESSATLFFDEAYLKTNLKEAVTAK